MKAFFPHRFRWRGVVAALLALALWPPSAPAQEQRYRERQVLDPNTGEWVDEDRPPAEGGPADELDEARLLIVQNEHAKARDLLKRWLKENPDHERFAEAQFLLGETYFLRKDFWKAVEQYQTVAENASGDLFRVANMRCVDVGRAFLAGQRRIVWGFLRLPAQDDGLEILDRVWQREPGGRLGEIALRMKGDFHHERGENDLAADEYANLVQNYPSGRWIQFAMLRTAESAEASFPGVRFDDRPLIEADARYRQFQGTFPGYAEQERVAQRLEGIRQQRGLKDLEVAKWYERTRRSDAAEYYYRLVLKDWPETLAAAEARGRLRALGVNIEPEPEAETETAP